MYTGIEKSKSIDLHAWTSDTDQKSIFDHDRLIGLQKSIFQSDHRFLIFYDRSFHFLMINFLIFFSTMKKHRYPMGQRH